MENTFFHEIELYPHETFKTLLAHEVNRSRRYGSPLTLIHFAVETNDGGAHAQHSAEVFAVNVLNLQIRETDIPCKKDNEFLVLLPSTDQKGGRIVCGRLERLFNLETRVYNKVSFKMNVYIGMATLPGDRSISSKELMENASEALRYARENRLATTVIFSEIQQ
jgi:PleD family two-component response regulator